MSNSPPPAQRPSANRHHYADVLAVVLLVLAVLTATWKLGIAEHIIARGDLLLYFYPLRDYASQAIRVGYLPLWNPYSFMGAPFLANSQVGFYYPFNVVTAWLPVARAVSLNIVLHLLIATLAMYTLARRGMRLSHLASGSAALMFGLGGYLGAQIEHLNQLQVLAWLPLQVLLILGQPQHFTCALRRCCVLALLVALQVTAGHTQSLYISIATLGILITARWFISAIIAWRTNARSVPKSRKSEALALAASLGVPFLIVAAAVGIGGFITAGQLLPTLELAGQSARSGGLSFNEVGSFSWRPWVMARALLPAYGDPLFAEYISYLGVVGLALAALGVNASARALVRVLLHADNDADEKNQTVNEFSIVITTVIGIVLALGIATPLFIVLYHMVPGFELFRAQARWLIVFALGASVLVGIGVQVISKGLTTQLHRQWLLSWLALAFLVVIGILLGARYSPEAEYQSLPAQSILLAWLISFVVATGVIGNLGRKPTNQRAKVVIVAGLLAVELLIASQYQPYSRTADAQALTELRPSTANLLARQLSTDLPTTQGQRVLALTGLFFDPGDLPEQRLLYTAALTADELYDRIIASKHKEILSPNLSLLYQLPSVDGYDGGLLPLQRFARFTEQLHSTDSETAPAKTTDGRLRENLDAIPADEWLQRMAVKYIITDKTRDIFVNNVYYDLQVEQPIAAETSLPLHAFESTALGVVVKEMLTPNAALQATITFTDGTSYSTSVSQSVEQNAAAHVFLLDWATPKVAAQVTFQEGGQPVTITGMTSIDERTGAFLSQPVHGDRNLRLAYSGDVKVYENQNTAPRVFFVPASNCSTEDGELVITAEAQDDDVFASGYVQIIAEQPERMELRVAAEVPGWLVVRDAFYPGWIAHVDGVGKPIVVTDRMFRAIELLPGTHDITFSYEPESVRIGFIASAVGLLIWFVLTGWSFVSLLRQRRDASLSSAL